MRRSPSAGGAAPARTRPAPRAPPRANPRAPGAEPPTPAGRSPAPSRRKGARRCRRSAPRSRRSALSGHRQQPRTACLPACLPACLRNSRASMEALERSVERRQRLFDRRLQPLPDDVDLGVVGDRLQRDVGHAPVDQALAQPSVCLRVLRRAAGDLGLLLLPFPAVCQQVVRISCAHDPCPRQGQRHPGGVDRDPASPPLLGDVGGGAGSAGRVEHEVAGIGGHEDAAFHCFCCGLHDIDLRVASTLNASDIQPHIRAGIDREVIQEPDVADRFTFLNDSPRPR